MSSRAVPPSHLSIAACDPATHHALPNPVTPPCSAVISRRQVRLQMLAPLAQAAFLLPICLEVRDCF